MKTNQSKNERIARVVAGLALLKSGRKIGLVPLITGATGYCPVKSKLLGISDVKQKVKGSGKCCSSKKACHKTDTTSEAKTA